MMNGIPVNQAVFYEVTILSRGKDGKWGWFHPSGWAILIFDMLLHEMGIASNWQLRHCQPGCWLRHERCLLGFSLSTSYAGAQQMECVSCQTEISLDSGSITGNFCLPTKSAGLLIFFTETNGKIGFL